MRAAWRGFAGRTTYDALGRRLKKEVIIGNASADASTLDIHYYGWDGDRLIHTEHLDPEHPGERQITHTVYEPQSFTPMLRLSTCGKAAAKPHRLVQALQERTDAPEDEAALASLQAALQALPASMQQSLNEATTQALEQGLPAPALTMLGDAGPATRQHLDRMKMRLQKEEQQHKPPVEIHFYHCDHLGTPIALTDRNHHVIWAAKLDPWGNLEEEYNPNRIDQPIRLPGQHHDRETGLYYNRHRYYDPGLGSYISQDPIGWFGGINHYGYPKNPLGDIDPRGLWASQSGAYVHQRAGYLVFGKEITRSQLSAVARGHVWADSDQHQTADFAYMHAMRRPGQSTAEACQATNKYIREEARKALNAKASGDMNSAFFHFGAALHAIQDATSPAHTGFQVWSGTEGLLDEANHVRKEVVVPSEDSPLFKVTEKAWKAFKNSDMHGFGCPCD